MGVLYDYFRAADTSAVMRLMESTGGGVPMLEGQVSQVDVVNAKGIDPDVILGQVVAFILEVPWDDDLMEGEDAWPPDNDLDDTYQGPLVTGIPDRARDALAGVDDSEFSGLAARWAGIEEFAHYSDMGPDTLLPVLTELVGLARRARDAGQRLYCSMSL